MEFTTEKKRSLPEETNSPPEEELDVYIMKTGSLQEKDKKFSRGKIRRLKKQEIQYTRGRQAVIEGNTGRITAKGTTVCQQKTRSKQEEDKPFAKGRSSSLAEEERGVHQRKKELPTI